MPLSFDMINSVAPEVTAVTPSDSSANEFTYLYIGTGGDVVVIPEGGSTSVTFANVADGSFLWVRTSKVMAATSASDILGLK